MAANGCVQGAMQRERARVHEHGAWTHWCTMTLMSTVARHCCTQCLYSGKRGCVQWQRG